MEVPVTREARLAEDRSDSHFTINNLKSPNSAEDDLIIARLAKTRPQSASAPQGVKRRKSKPTRFEISGNDAQKEHTPPKQQGVNVNDPISPRSSLQKEKSVTKGFQTPIPSSPAMIRAVGFRSRLGVEFPSCIKMMVKSQVSCGFWMGLPLQFCKSFLPKEDTTIILEDESGQKYEAKYIAYKSGLSAGWKAFAIKHELIEGDVLVFHLVESSKFKVYILRGSDSNEVDGALSLLNLESPTEQITPDDDMETVTPSPKTKRSNPEPLPLSVVKKKQKKSIPSSRSLPNSQLSSHRIEHSGNNSEEVGSEVLEGTKSYEPDLSFQEIKTFKDFCIAVKDLCLDTELPDDLRTGYYKLCLDRKQFLHHGLREGLFYKLVAGMIGETVTIANEIKNCKLTTTTQDELEGWDNTLNCFELMGMKVGFLRDRICALAKMAFETEDALEIKRYLESKNEETLIKDEIKKVTAKLLELKESAKKFEGIPSSLKKKAEKYEEKFQYEVDAPW